MTFLNKFEFEETVSWAKKVKWNSIQQKIVHLDFSARWIIFVIVILALYSTSSLTELVTYVLSDS